MTDSQEVEFNVLGCKVKVQPNKDDGKAKFVIDSISAEISQLKSKRPMLRDTDVAVLVALKVATEKLELEDEYKKNIFKLEESLELALSALGTQAN